MKTPIISVVFNKLKADNVWGERLWSEQVTKICIYIHIYVYMIYNIYKIKRINWWRHMSKRFEKMFFTFLNTLYICVYAIWTSYSTIIHGAQTLQPIRDLPTLKNFQTTLCNWKTFKVAREGKGIWKIYKKLR